MFHILCAFSIISLVFASENPYRYGTLLTSGYLLDYPSTSHVEKVSIPAGQCSGELLYPRDYVCKSRYGRAKPMTLQVEVQDYEGPPAVAIAADFEKVTIHRVGRCENKAPIKVTAHCPFIV